MAPNILIGIVLTLTGGVIVGNCMVPLKFARTWAWENMWMVFNIFSLILIPWALAFGTIPDVTGIYTALGVGPMVVPFLFGFGWGIAQVLFGLAVVRLGMSLGFAIVVGLGAMLGSLVPLLVQHREVLGTTKGGIILCGVVAMLAGIAVCALAGRRRDRAAAAGGLNLPGAYRTGLLIAICSGLLAPMLNYALAFGDAIAGEAMRQGASAANASYAVWPIGLLGGFIPNFAYSAYLLTRNKTWSRFRRPLPDVSFGALMGLLWMGSVAIYGVGATYLGPLGTSVGWALFQIFMIMTANVSGLIAGEWRGAARQPVRILYAGLAVLALATAVISYGNSVP
jgi:L-rhamnose-H+ transport protein